MRRTFGLTKLVDVRSKMVCAMVDIGGGASAKPDGNGDSFSDLAKPGCITGADMISGEASIDGGTASGSAGMIAL